MKFSTVFLILFITLITYNYRDLFSSKYKFYKSQIDTIENHLELEDTLSYRVYEIMGILDYKVEINDGTDFWLHKDSLKSIMAKIEVDHIKEIIRVNINNPEVIEELKKNYRKTGNLAFICAEYHDVNYVVGDNSLFDFLYYDYGNSLIENEPFIFNQSLIIFLRGCNGYNMFSWKIKGDSLKLKTVYPDFLTYPTMLSYRTRIGVEDIITDDSINYFFVVLKEVNWLDPVDAEHVECDENSSIHVLHYNSDKYKSKMIYQYEIQEEHQFDGMSRIDSLLIIKHSHHTYTLLFKDKDGNIVESSDDYPFENPDLIQYDQIHEAENFSDTLLINKFIE